MNEARDYELSASTDNGDRPMNDADENRVLTLAELKELIESGNMDKIPNNKIIPETLNVRFLFFFILIFFKASSKSIFTIGCTSKSINGSYKKETLGGGHNIPIKKIPLTIYMYVVQFFLLYYEDRQINISKICRRFVAYGPSISLQNTKK